MYVPSKDKPVGWSHYFNRRNCAALEGRHMPSVPDLLLGMVFLSNSLATDAKVWAERLLLRLDRLAEPERVNDVKSVLQRLTVSPDVGDFVDAATALRNRNFPPDSWLSRSDGELRCIVYAAAAGDCDAITTVASEIATFLRRRARDHDEIIAGMSVILGLMLRLDERNPDEARLSLSPNEHSLACNANHIVTRLAAGLVKTELATRDRELATADQPKTPSIAVDAADPTVPGLIVFTGYGNEIFSDNERLKRTLQPLIGAKLPLLPLPCLKQMTATLLTEFPHAKTIIDTIIADLGSRRFAGLRPTILCGPPGCGKTSFAMRVGQLLNVTTTLYGCAGIQDSAFAGTARRWSTGEPALPVATIMTSGAANPLFIMDEIEKVGSGRHNGNLIDALLPMLEPRSAASFFDVLIQANVDLSGVIWLATSNDTSILSSPLRDRFRILHFPAPSVAHLPMLAPPILARIVAAQGLDSRWSEDFSAWQKPGVAARYVDCSASSKACWPSETQR
jgi:hypothetical protein